MRKLFIGVAVLLVFIALTFGLLQVDAIRYKYMPCSEGILVYKIDRLSGEVYKVGPWGVKKISNSNQ